MWLLAAAEQYFIFMLFVISLAERNNEQRFESSAMNVRDTHIIIRHPSFVVRDHPALVEHGPRRASIEARQISLDQRNCFVDQLIQLIDRRAWLSAQSPAQPAIQIWWRNLELADLPIQPFVVW